MEIGAAPEFCSLRSAGLRACVRTRSELERWNECTNKAPQGRNNISPGRKPWVNWEKLTSPFRGRHSTTCNSLAADSQPLAQPLYRKSHTNEELPKQRIHRTDFVEAHFVNQFLEHQRIEGKQIHAPLPIVEADGARDNLLHLAGVAAAHHAVFFHLALALLDGQRIPILLFTALTIHGIKAQVAAVRNLRIEPRTHGFTLPLQGLFYGVVPLLRKRLHSTVGELPKQFYAGVVQAQLDHRQIRVHGLEKILQGGAVQLQFSGVKLVEGVTEVDNHQIALVPQHGINGALPKFFAGCKYRGGFARNVRLARCVQLAPLRPAKAEHLMQHAQPFKGKRHRWQLGGHSLDSGIAGWHCETPR